MDTCAWCGREIPDGEECQCWDHAECPYCENIATEPDGGQWWCLLCEILFEEV